MITGIGIDVIRIPRIERILSKYGEIFKNRILVSSEIQQLGTINPDKHASFIAKRFAAKEAISKALGNGIGRGLSFKDITIFNNKAGKPLAIINAEKTGRKNFKIDLSLSDDYPVAIAAAVISED